MIKLDYDANLRDYETYFGGLKPRLEHFQAKESLVRYDEAIQSFRYLLKGKAKIYMIHEDGKRSIIHFVKPGEYIGELSLIGIEKTPKHVVAISDCVCLSIPMAAAKAHLLHDPNFLLKLSQYIGKKLLDRTWFNAKSLNYELKHRLAAYMLMADNHGFFNEKHTETADFLSVSYRHLLYTISQFQETGLIVKLKRGYQLNREALADLAKDFDVFFKG